jgi:tryptophan halogenase
LYSSSGRFFTHNAQELFAAESWVQVLLGQGFQMNADPVTQFVSDEQLADFLTDVVDVIEDVAEKMPDHGAFLRGLPKERQAPPTPAVDFALRYERGEAVG